MSNLASHSSYWVKSYSNQVVIWGATATPSGPKYTVSQNIYAILDNVNIQDTSAANIFYQDSFEAYENVGTYVPVKVSPYLTKIHYEYFVNASTTAKSLFLLDIDWWTASAYQVTHGNPTAYNEVTQNMNSFTQQNYYLGDYYWIIRNDSSSTGNGTAVESTYQFVG